MTPGAKKVLRELATNDRRDLVREGLSAYCGQRRIAPRIVTELLGCMAVSISWNEGKATYYSINCLGRSLLRRPELETELFKWMAQRRDPFTVINDRIVKLDDPR